MAEWQPKATAPKDGEPFLGAIYWDDTGEWEVLRVHWAEEIGKFVDATYDPFQNAAENMTHWMPLPAPPETITQS